MKSTLDSLFYISLQLHWKMHVLQKINTFEVLVKSKYSLKIVSEYDQEIPQSQTADNPVAPRGRAAQPSQDTRKTN